MTESVQLVSPKKLTPNPSNPRLIFRESETRGLEESISEQGILVPLTVYADGSRYRILDGERRWRCATRLKFDGVPVIVQPKPGPLENLMMMFAIHNTRRDWDPLPTAYSLEKLQGEYEKKYGREPNEEELAQLASIKRGEVRRLRALLALPQSERNELMKELEKPRSERAITADQVLEATKAASQLRKRGIVDASGETKLRRAVVKKFKSRVVRNTVDPRKLARLARAVEREEVKRSTASRVVRKLIEKPNYSIDDAFHESVERTDYLHGSLQLSQRLTTRLEEQLERGYKPTDELSLGLRRLRTLIERLLRS